MSQRVASLDIMGRWWTSDHHFGHEKIIGYCARPFANADAMNRAMVECWNCDAEPRDASVALRPAGTSRLRAALTSANAGSFVRLRAQM